MCKILNASNDAILGDCVRYQMYINAAKRCVKYWLKILHLLYFNGFGYVWERQLVRNENQFVNILIERLKDQYLQQWYFIISRNSKLGAYTGFKTVYGYESYLDHITTRKFRRTLSQFRVSSHCLEIEKGRHSGVARIDRICKICQSSIEDEYHFVFICDIYIYIYI